MLDVKIDFLVDNINNIEVNPVIHFFITNYTSLKKANYFYIGIDSKDYKGSGHFILISVDSANSFFINNTEVFSTEYKILCYAFINFHNCTNKNYSE